MRTVGEILSSGQKSFFSIRPEATVFEALNLMAEKNIGALVINDGSKLLGVFSERDYTRKVLFQGRSPETTPLNEVMTKEVLAVSSDILADECLSRMNRRGVRHVPVVDGDALVGFVSILEVVDAVLEQREQMISHLEKYVSETWPI